MLVQEASLGFLNALQDGKSLCHGGHRQLRRFVCRARPGLASDRLLPIAVWSSFCGDSTIATSIPQLLVPKLRAWERGVNDSCSRAGVGPGTSDARRSISWLDRACNRCA